MAKNIPQNATVPPGRRRPVFLNSHACHPRPSGLVDRGCPTCAFAIGRSPSNAVVNQLISSAKEHYTQEEAPNKDAKLAWLRSSCDSRSFLAAIPGFVRLATLLGC